MAVGPRSPQGRLPAVLGVLLAACLLITAATAAGATAPGTFVSHRYGYSVVLPGGATRWSLAPAIVGWSLKTIEPGSPVFDTLTDLATGRRFVIAARRSPRGTTLAGWTAFAATTISVECTKPTSFSRTTLGGSPAEIFSWRCSDDLNTIGIAALHGTRGYFMFVPSPTNLSLASNRRAVDVFRRAFRFSR